MKTKHQPTPEEVLKDLKFMLEQSWLIEHEQDYERIRALCRKYGVCA